MSGDRAEFVFKEVMVFLKMSTSLHQCLATDTHLADGEFYQAAVNKEGILNLRNYAEELEYQ
jgi:hypothetical protein